VSLSQATAWAAPWHRHSISVDKKKSRACFSSSLPQALVAQDAQEHGHGSLLSPSHSCHDLTRDFSQRCATGMDTRPWRMAWRRHGKSWQQPWLLIMTSLNRQWLTPLRRRVFSRLSPRAPENQRALPSQLVPSHFSEAICKAAAPNEQQALLRLHRSMQSLRNCQLLKAWKASMDACRMPLRP
jgi:hypothetical protein